MKKLLIISGIVVFFSACKSGGWTEAQKDKLRKTCTDPMEGKIDLKTATKYCDCVIEQAMKKYKTYDELDKKGTEEEGRQMGMNCIGELKPMMDKGAGGETTNDSTK